MRVNVRRIAIGVTSIALAAALAACGEAGGGDDEENADGGSGNGGGGGGTIGILLPDNVTTRYEAFDRPVMEATIEELCPDCEIQYNNATQDTALQKQQFDAMLTEGVDVIVLDPVDASATSSWVEDAAAEDVPVIAYDRLAEGDVAAYISYDNERVGQLQGEALLETLGDEAEGARVVMLNGSPTDPNAALFKAGAHSALHGTVEIVYETDVDGWDPPIANERMSAAIDAVGADGFDAVYVANDGLASGAITALQAANIEVPVGGQDAELAGIQRIVAGEQTYTIYKAFVPQAEIAGEIAVRLLNGEDIDDLAGDSVDSPTTQGIPSALLEPIAVTVDNLQDTILADEVYTVEEICTEEYAAACQEAGIG